MLVSHILFNVSFAIKKRWHSGGVTINSNARHNIIIIHLLMKNIYQVLQFKSRLNFRKIKVETII